MKQIRLEENPIKFLEKFSNVKLLDIREEAFERHAPIFIEDPYQLHNLKKLPHFEGLNYQFTVKFGRDWHLTGHRSIYLDGSFFIDKVIPLSDNRNQLQTDIDGIIKQLGDHYFINEISQNPRIHISGETGLAVSAEPSNWGAFLTRVLPKAIYLKEIGCNRLLCYCEHSAQRKMLNMAGWADAEIIRHNPKAVYTFDSAIYVSEFTTDLFLNRVAKLLLKSIKVEKSEFLPKSLFISKRQSSTTNKRVATNIEESENVAKKAGMTVIYPETLAPKHQLELFYNAKIIAGPSGSSLFNAVFCNSFATIVDIESERDWLHAHCNLFSSLKLNYGIVFAKPSKDEPPHRPYEIDTDNLSHALNMASKFNQ